MSAQKLKLFLVGLTFTVSATALAAPQYSNQTISGYYDNTYTFGISGVFNNSHTEFKGDGNANGWTGAICADGTANLWDAPLRYAGEFSGIRIAAAVSICQGFGTTSEQVGGFDGKTTLGTLFTGGARLIAPLNLNGFIMMPSIGAGWGIGNVKIQASPFESDRSWRSGLYFEAVVAMPVSNWGVRNTQNIDAAAMEIYLGYKRWQPSDQTLDGGARTETKFDFYSVGFRRKM
jgi:hypothetical protein